MRIVNSYNAIITYVNSVRGLHKGFITNFFPDQRKVDIWCSHKMFWVQELDEAVLFIKKDDGFTSVMYCATNLEKLFAAISQLPSDNVYVIDQIVDARTDTSMISRFETAGFKVRKTLLRMSKVIKESLNVTSEGCFNATESDIPVIRELLFDNFDKLSEQLPTNEELKDFVDNQHIIVKKINNLIAGFIIYDQTPSTLYLRYWLVNNRFRNQGVGSALFREFSKRGNSCKRHMLWVMEDNDNAIVRYKHYGYKEENMKNYVLTLNLNI